MFKTTTGIGINGRQSFVLPLIPQWQESTGFTPAEVMLGQKLKGPLERAILKTPDLDSPGYHVLEKYKELIKTVQRNVERAQKKDDVTTTAYEDD